MPDDIATILPRRRSGGARPPSMTLFVRLNSGEAELLLRIAHGCGMLPEEYVRHLVARHLEEEV